MTELSEILPQRIRSRLTETGKSMRAVSLEIGAHAGYVRDLLDSERFTVPSSLKLQGLANALDTTTEYLLGTASDPAQIRSEVSLAERRMEWVAPSPESIPGIPLVGTGDCADLSVTDADGNTVTIERNSFDPDYHVRMITRPPALRGLPDLYAIYFHGESMVPRFEPGEVGIVDPRRPPRPGDYVLVQLAENGGDEVSSVLVKRLVKMNSRQVELEQFNPATTFTLPREKVVRIHRILQQTDLLL